MDFAGNPELSVALSLAAGLGLAAGGCAYAAMWPTSRIFGSSLIAPKRPGELALTFDDGPHPRWTPLMLDMLAQHGVRGTFFLLGSRAQAQPALVRRIVQAGHTLGNHSWEHLNLARTRATRVQEELQRTKETVEQIVGAPMRFFRPPYGGRRPAVLRIARSLGMVPVMWNAMTSDWAEPSAVKIAARLAMTIDRRQRQGRAATIVLHDGHHLEMDIDRQPSVSAAGLLLARYKATHTFVTVDAWV